MVVLVVNGTFKKEAPGSCMSFWGRAGSWDETAAVIVQDSSRALADPLAPKRGEIPARDTQDHMTLDVTAVASILTDASNYSAIRNPRAKEEGSRFRSSCYLDPPIKFLFEIVMMFLVGIHNIEPKKGTTSEGPYA